MQSGGTLNVTSRNGCRRTADITLDNWAGLYDYHVDKLFFGQQIRLSAGVYLDDGTPFYLPQGVFYVSNPSEVFEPAGRTTTLSLVDKWAFLDGTLFGKVPGVYILSAGDNLFQAARNLLLTDRGNGLPLDGVPPMLSADYTGRTVDIGGVGCPVLQCPYTARISTTYGGVLEEIATMLVAVVARTAPRRDGKSGCRAGRAATGALGLYNPGAGTARPQRIARAGGDVQPCSDHGRNAQRAHGCRGGNEYGSRLAVQCTAHRQKDLLRGAAEVLRRQSVRCTGRVLSRAVPRGRQRGDDCERAHVPLSEERAGNALPGGAGRHAGIPCRYRLDAAHRTNRPDDHSGNQTGPRGKRRMTASTTCSK